MHICMLATTFPRFTTDYAGQFVFGYARALVAEGAAVTVVVPHDGDSLPFEVVDGVTIRRFAYWFPKSAQGLCYGAGIPTNIRRRKWLALQLPFLEAGFVAAALRYGVQADIYNPHWTFAGLATVAASWLNRKPVVTTAYSAEYVPRALREPNKLIVHNSDAVISISQFTYDMVEQTIVPRQHHVIGYGVNPEKIASPDLDVDAFRIQQGIASNEIFVFAVGRLVERKGYHVLIEAIAQLVRQGIPVHLVLAGTGPQQQALQDQIAAESIQSAVTLLGFIPDSELKDYLRAADMLVMPSIADQSGDTEGLGIPSLEAMANGSPVIASDIGGIVDIVKHEETGILVPPDDAEAIAAAIMRLSQDKELHTQIVTGGYAMVNGDFSWGTIARRSIEVFESVMHTSQGNA